MLRPIPLKNIRIHDAFFSGRIETARRVAIPYMLDALNDRIPGVPRSGCIANFEIAAGRKEGSFTGFVFQDSDLWKWIEGAAYSLAGHPDPELEKEIDRAIELAGEAQLPDGYLDTYYIINGIEKRFTNLKDNHEMYVAGHMFEAACAYYEVTGKRALLEIACRFADCIDAHFGPEEGKRRGYPGHEEIELGLARLAAAAGEPQYLKLAAFFLDERGKQPYYFDLEAEERGDKAPGERKNQFQTYSYYQADRPVREQTAAVGHAVRQGYLLAGMAEVGGQTRDAGLTDAARRIWENIVSRQMYITGGVGSTHEGEAYSFDYDLPPERCYTETCAAISLAMTSVRLGRIEPNGKYGDIVERTLYNGILSGVSLDGTRYFYMNPLEVWPERCEKRQDLRIDAERQGWFGCACCPPNVLRTLTGLGNYLFETDGDTLYVDQYVSCSAEAELESGRLSFELESRMPWEGLAEIRILRPAAGCRIRLRIPSWAGERRLLVNGRETERKEKDGYITLEGPFGEGDVIRLELPMQVKLMHAAMHTPNYAGKRAVMKGPLVYCMEEADNGRELWNLSVEDGPAEAEHRADLLNGVDVIRLRGQRETTDEALYSDGRVSREPAELTLVPYYAWGNRGKGEMAVWIRKA